MRKLFPFIALITVLFLFSCKEKSDKQMTSADPQLDSLLALGRLSPELLWKLGRVGEFDISPDGKRLVYSVTRYNIKENKGDGNLYLMNTDGCGLKQLTSLLGSESNPCWRPDGKKIGFLSSKSGSSQIWEMDTDGTFSTVISSIKGDVGGFNYAPDMEHIAFFREVKIDTTPNEKYPDLPKANCRVITDMMYRHWDSWHQYTYSHIFIAPYSNGKLGDAIDIMAGQPYDAPVKTDGGMEQVAWSPDGSKLAFVCKQNKGTEYSLSTNSDIFVYDLKTKLTSNLSKGMLGYDKDPVFSPDGSKIVWRSMETPGFESDKDRIMIHDFITAATTDYSSGFDQSSAEFKWSEDGTELYFISGIHATYQVYRMTLADKIIQKITAGNHDYSKLAYANGILVGSRMSLTMPVELYRIDVSTGKQTQLTYTNKAILDKIKMARVEERWIKTSDGKDMLTWVLYPPDFDSSKKYPALLYCQGGPQSAVSQFFSYRWNLQLMASGGYIVVAPNRRGLPTFGQAWNDQISGDYGGQNIQDYLSAIDAVAAEPYVDKDHLGAVGASYGGYSVFYLAGHHQKRFKAFISHCGMFNLESQYASTEEYWFVNHDLGGAPWQEPKPKSYDFSPHRFVKDWDTPIMISSGGNDFRIPYTESLQAFNAAQLKGIPSKLVFFPEETHFIMKPQNSILWQREFFGWLDHWLK